MSEPLEALRGYVHHLHEREGVRRVRLSPAARQGLAKLAAEAGSRHRGTSPPGDGVVAPRAPVRTESHALTSAAKAPSPGGRRLPEETVARSATATTEALEIIGSTKAEQLRHLAERAAV